MNCSTGETILKIICNDLVDRNAEFRLLNTLLHAIVLPCQGALIGPIINNERIIVGASRVIEELEGLFVLPPLD